MYSTISDSQSLRLIRQNRMALYRAGLSHMDVALHELQLGGKSLAAACRILGLSACTGSRSLARRISVGLCDRVGRAIFTCRAFLKKIVASAAEQRRAKYLKNKLWKERSEANRLKKQAELEKVSNLQQQIGLDIFKANDSSSFTDLEAQLEVEGRWDELGALWERQELLRKGQN